MWMPDKEYYKQFEEEMIRDCKEVMYHTRQAENYNRLYNSTKGKKGLNRLLNKWAKKKNQEHCKIGTELALKRLGMLGYEMDHLIEYEKSFKYLEDKA